jgi:hypothetical protein
VVCLEAVVRVHDTRYTIQDTHHVHFLLRPLRFVLSFDAFYRMQFKSVVR